MIVQKSKSGFSLIEMLVAIGIVMILFSAGIASYRNATRNQALDSDVALIIQVLNIAKTNVNSGKKIACADLSINLPLKYWQVKFFSDYFELQEICEDGTADGKLFVNNSYKLASKNIISTNPSSIFLFKALGQGATAGTINIGAKIITVNSIGIIQ